VADATVIVTIQIPMQESLYLTRYNITLPLSGLNKLFGVCKTAFNFHTKLDSDQNYFLDFDGTEKIYSLGQKFNPSLTDIEQWKKCFFLVIK
jgi:hypothetical protein